MSTPTYIDSTQINDGKGGLKEVRPGDRVEILPIEIPRYPSDTDGHRAREENFQFLKRWLGDGPYRIFRIGQWQFDSIMLYLGTDKGSPGVHAYDFMSVD